MPETGNGEYKQIETAAFDTAIEECQNILESFNQIREKCNQIQETLLQNWRGCNYFGHSGAYAYEQDSTKVQQNMSDIFDALTSMTNTLQDCKELFLECDKKIGEFNENPFGG